MTVEMPSKEDVFSEISRFEGREVDPQQLVDKLCQKFSRNNVIESLQCAIERGQIALNSQGYVIALSS